MKRTDLFYQLGKLIVIYNGLEEESKRIFLRSLNKNPWSFLFSYPPDNETDFYDYEKYNNYFLFEPDCSNKRIYFVDKRGYEKVHSNIKVSMKNQWLAYPHKLN